MTQIIRGAFSGIARFFKKEYCRRFVYLLLLGIPAFFEYWSGGLVRRTFVFYMNDPGKTEIEERFLPSMPCIELAVRQYIEETLLGPILPDSDPLFSKETKLKSLLFRDGIVYADLSQTAALPYSVDGDAFKSLYVLHNGIRRNFDFVREVRFFIDGREAYYERFRSVSFSYEEQAFENVVF
ncbi:MAG: GerMN domain-containing protein [Treponema sp.]|jgi:hypothetical protein|nr:GerMN domain-containing protein [Treponema sp.]